MLCNALHTMDSREESRQSPSPQEADILVQKTDNK